VQGSKVYIPNPSVARELGIILMHQEPLTFPTLDITENIFVGHTRDDGGLFIKWGNKRRIARELLDSINLNIDETSMVKGLSIANKQIIEIVSALSVNAKVIIMDEPTAALTLDEVNRLFSIIKKLKEAGKAIVFISHRLEEVEIIADRVTVLRDGNKVCERMAKDTSRDMMVNLMIGRTLDEQIKKEKILIGDVLLKVENLTLPGKFEDISIEVKRGEVVGIAGLVGAGRTEVANAIFGITPPKSGKIFIKGVEEKINNPMEAINKGMALVPEDRPDAGLLMSFTINQKKENNLVEGYVKDLSIMLRSTGQEAGELSGGNQQKVVVSKWLMTKPDILLLDEPTRGIDVGAKAEVYKLISKLAREGKAILMISSEMEEVIQLCDRVYVMCEGRITTSLRREELNEARIMTAASRRMEVYANEK
jgi:ABC-type sugar transport system ATPase subunit